MCWCAKTIAPADCSLDSSLGQENSTSRDLSGTLFLTYLNVSSCRPEKEVAFRLDKHLRFGKSLALPMKSSATAAIPLVRGQNVQASSRRRFFDYRRLFSVGIRHEFYAHGHINGDLFRVSPTPRTAARLAALGMVFRSERGGFSVVCDIAQSWQARAEAGDASEPLTFEVVCADPHFVTITNIDLATSPRATPFHFSNRLDSSSMVPASRGRAGATAEPPSPLPLHVELRYEASPGALVQAGSDFRPIPIALVQVVLDDGSSPGGCAMPVDGIPVTEPVSYEVVFEARKGRYR